MASALEEREEQSSKCFICNVKVTTRSSFNVYCTFMPQREVLLMDVMSKILKKVFNPSQMRSSVLCRRCFTLFGELDQISTRFKKLQADIIKRYLSTCIEYKDDTFLSVVNTICPTKIHELPLSEQISENTFLSNEDENGEKSSNNALNEIVDTIINSIQAEETMDNVDTIVTNIEAEEIIDNVDTIVTNIEAEETMDNVDTIVTNIEAEETMDNVDTIVTNIEAEETVDNVNTIVSDIETEETVDNIDTIVNNIEAEENKDNVGTIVTNIEAEETMDNVDTIVSNIEDEGTVDNVDTIISNIEVEETMDNEDTIISNIKDEGTVDNVDTIISNIEVEETMDNEDTIISNIKVEETIDNGTDYVKSTSDSYIETNVSLNKEIMKHDDTKKNQQVILLPKSVEETMCKTKLRKRSVGIGYKCEQCDDSFRRALDLKNHHAMVHQTLKRFFCSSCNKSYSTKQSLNNHLVKEHTSLGKQITDQADSNSFKIDNDISQCDRDCNLEVSAEYANDSSEDVVIDVKPDFNIDNSMYLEEVVEEENEDDDFEWKEEEKFDYNNENIVEDSSSALDETNPSSGSERSGKRQMKKGRKKKGYSRSGERACLPAIHNCGLCGKKWRTVTELKSHIQSHSSIRPYVCEICGQAYKMKKALDVHIGMHNGIHPFTCEYCHKSFTQKVGLQKHIPIHTGYTRFQCDLCGKRFIHQKSFHIHTMTHTGEKHVKCTECGLAVLSQSHLKRHLRVHTGERPYACPICGKRFAEKYNMNAHVHIHDNNAGNGPRRNRNHICQLCGMSYDRKHKLEYHLASTHNKIDSKLPQDQESVQHHQTKNEYFQENSQGHQIITVNNSAIEPCGISYEHKLKLEYNLTSPHNKIESKPSQNPKTEQQSQNEYFQEGHKFITVENRAIENKCNTAMITVSGVKVPLSLDGAPIMVTALPQESQTTGIVPLNIPAGSILTYTPTSSNDNDQPMVDSTQNPVTIQL